MTSCPKCSNEGIMKVSEVFSSGIREIKYEKPLFTDMFGKLVWYGEIPQEELAYSPVSIKLFPPFRPAYYGSLVSSEQGVIFSVVRVALSLAIINLLYSQLMLTDIVSGFLQRMNKGIGYSPSTLIWIGMFILTSLAGLVLLYELIRVRDVKSKISRWENAVSRWYLLYYCSTCESVFIPEDNVVVPCERMIELLYP